MMGARWTSRMMRTRLRTRTSRMMRPRRRLRMRLRKKKKDNVEIKNEIDILIASDAHPHIIRFHGYERENDVAYLCLEQWKLSLDVLPKFAQKQLRK
ncbi:Inactive serine/threonine-protein kinase/endoribonuclease IRE1-like [Cardamine amara subsp. amara]|uniref:Inactive serine/threonine-protein kinase/endoribonuclease IRE1-like n=1 Tax=Cardamine amara subsp. amara TaxID=228776 RepID=A0ABD0Z2Q4_CARAN